MANAATDRAPLAETPAAGGQKFDVVLKSLSDPALDDIRIDDDLFAIGRAETPFVSYDAERIADLSRRHARIFTEFGAVYVADLGSKNGTTLNGVALRQRPSQLRDGDEVCFGPALCFKVQLGARTAVPWRASKLLSLTLTPERNDLGLQPIVISHFPFLVSKGDDIFSRYREDYPHQIDYLSRRHAHIFLKNGAPWVEDLGSTNGTFVAGQRLDEHALELHDGDLLAFGGHHFVYQVSLQKEVVSDPTVTRLRPLAASAAPGPGEDKTTFVAAADSFLDIFCIDPPPADEAVDQEAAETPAKAALETDGRGGKGKRRKIALFLSELGQALGGGERQPARRALRRGAGLAAALGILVAGLVVMLYLSGAPERDVQILLDSGDYAQAAISAGQSLARQPDNPQLRALGSEALLKAKVPDWLALIKAREFERAAATVTAMQELGAHNADVLPLLGEFDWLGSLEKFVAGNAGVGSEAPIRIYADEETIGALLKQWDADPQAHQRAFTTIAAHVPEFRDWYPGALSHLRKLQSDVSVYLAAIDRLKTAIGTELNRDHPEVLEAILKDYAEKYPRLAGLDRLREDLRQYLEIDRQARARRLAPLSALLATARFSTPPFQARLEALKTSGRLPSPEVLGQYQAVAKAWREGATQQAFDGLQKMAAGAWADAAASEAAHKKMVVEQFAELQQARGSKAYDERLLAFYGVLDAEEDRYFIRATEAELALIKDKAIKRAQELLARAQARWRQYRDNGAIEGAQRLDAAISNQFRTQARLLSEADDDARQATRIYAQLKVELPEASNTLQGEIRAEAELQRNSLLELTAVLEPALLKAKLALIGGRSGDERQSP